MDATAPDHTDGEEICLAERQAWLAASQAGFARAYSDNEPDYSTAVLREANEPAGPAEQRTGYQAQAECARPRAQHRR